MKFRRASEDALRQEWGNEYRANIQTIGLLMDSHATPELFDRLQGARFADGSRLGDDPHLLQFLASVAREVHPDGNVYVSPASGASREQAIEDEIKTLELEMRDTKGHDPKGYWNDSRKQDRYLELVEAREQMKARRR